jgi:hypothetical protein
LDEIYFSSDIDDENIELPKKELPDARKKISQERKVVWER